MREFIPPATCFADLPAGFPMKRGGALYGARIAYETFGRLNAARDNAVLLLTGLSPDAHAASHPDDPAPGWWEPMLGPGKPIDTDRWHVICVNSLGSCKGSTGPASPDPDTGQPYRLDFPELSIEDIADAAARTVRALGVERLASVIGASMGGMSALALLARHPGLARSHINISGAANSLPFSIAIRSLQREAVRSDPNWNQGRYDEERYPERGMLTARKLGMTTYRSAQEWEHRFGRARLDPGRPGAAEPFGPEFAVEGYLEFHAQRFVRRFDPNSYLYLSRSMDRFDLGESCGSTAGEALSRLRLEKALVIGVRSDILFPLHQQREIAEGLSASGADVQFLALESQEGHDAFLVDTGRFGPPVAKFLSVGW
ncbi:homoserine O-acetyltransferase MetX [Marinitenerispora sediminis]|uniref:Serine O-succinyltransferase n=1 Tax=Marinitenerispora sediminis TaxID=1931232 RepID=A0A368TBY2_9ACTN|nr:homoserine O-acetyltransferase [Marinitenerispora sediminis]RCV57964.1 homoserine O-acetyltransferase [Marinitenerispora sediminis]RCV62303.1 homoserine O-acetyltransferase [Marinitenerispora sediminis]RCV62565.1 homoserine O-acetyltransferase [Marinitenerispora sediminis]